jgi:hypothetical protein
VEEVGGTLYLAASDPVPVSPPLDPTALLMGWLAGKRMAAMRGKTDVPSGEPIAYLYNGVQLPDINAVWTDKTAYPYAWVEAYSAEPFGYADANVAFLILASNRPTYNSTEGFVLSSNLLQYATTDSEQVASDFGLLSANVWDLSGNDTDNTWTMEAFDGRTYWSNHDILNTDGSTYLAASEPVAVYE